jgi:hypothetical protein
MYTAAYQITTRLNRSKGMRYVEHDQKDINTSKKTLGKGTFVKTEV